MIVNRCRISHRNVVLFFQPALGFLAKRVIFMSDESIDTLVIGGGQAGIAMSEHLSRHGVPHLVVERSRIAERWRSERWDSLVANGPAWHDRFPNLTFDNVDPDGFASREQIVSYFEDYARKIDAPIRCGVNITDLRRIPEGFLATSPSGTIACRRVVVATGPFQKPLIPTLVPAEAGVTQIHSNTYKNPEQMPEGAVLVIGAGSSGAQIADELLRAGRKVYLAIGPHDRPPRRYRGHDFVWWLGVLGMWDSKAATTEGDHVTISVSGARGGHTVDFRELASRGMNLVGKATHYENGTIRFSDDLAANIARGDANYLSMLDLADAYAEREGLDLPTEPDARIIGPDPACVTAPILHLDLTKENVTSIIWATGYALDFSWLEPDMLDSKGNPLHQNGIAECPGLYFLGLPGLTRRASPFIWGSWHDASLIADHMAQR